MKSFFRKIVIGVAFIIFNGAMGLIYNSLWHGTICIYYILLTLVRGIVILSKKVSKSTHLLLLLLNMALIVPIAIMVKGERSYEYGLIPAIAMAAYTTYRIVISIINLRRARKENDSVMRELRLIDMIDTLVAILSLQNAMIIANGGMTDKMATLAACSSAGIYVLIVLITIRSIVITNEKVRISK